MVSQEVCVQQWLDVLMSSPAFSPATQEAICAYYEYSVLSGIARVLYE